MEELTDYPPFPEFLADRCPAVRSMNSGIECSVLGIHILDPIEDFYGLLEGLFFLDEGDHLAFAFVDLLGAFQNFVDLANSAGFGNSLSSRNSRRFSTKFTIAVGLPALSPSALSIS